MIKLKEILKEFTTYTKHKADIEKVFKSVYGNTVKNIKIDRDGFIRVEFDASPKDIRKLGGTYSKEIEKVQKILSKKFKKDIYIDAIHGGNTHISYDIFSESNDINVNENRWLELKKADQTPNQKIGKGIREINYQLREIEKFVSWYSRIKNESDLHSDQYWKRTTNHLNKIRERLMRLSNKMNNL